MPELQRTSPTDYGCKTWGEVFQVLDDAHNTDSVEREYQFRIALDDCCTVADAVRGTDELGLALDEAEHVVLGLLGARCDARTASEAAIRIDDGMQRDRLRQPGLARLLEGRGAVRFLAAAPREIERPDRRERRGVDEIEPAVIHAHADVIP